MPNNKEDVYKLRAQGATWTYIGKTLGIDRRTAKSWCEQYEPKDSYRKLQEDLLPIDRFEPIHVYGDAVVTCDWHVPLHSPSMVNSVLEAGHQNDIDTLIIAGDLFNMDTFSHYLPHQPEAGFEIEKEHATNAVDCALDVFDKIVISWGNHDFRMVKATEFKLSFMFCMKWVLEGLGKEKLSRITFTDLDYLFYHPGEYDVRICHQTNFSKIPLTVPRQLAQKHHMSILAAHSHHFAQGVALDGKNLIFEGGGLFDPSRTEYIQRTNLHHKWVQGFYLWKDSIFTPYSPVFGNI